MNLDPYTSSDNDFPIIKNYPLGKDYLLLDKNPLYFPQGYTLKISMLEQAYSETMADGSVRKDFLSMKYQYHWNYSQCPFAVIQYLQKVYLYFSLFNGKKSIVIDTPEQKWIPKAIGSMSPFNFSLAYRQSMSIYEDVQFYFI